MAPHGWVVGGLPRFGQVGGVREAEGQLVEGGVDSEQDGDRVTGRLEVGCESLRGLGDAFDEFGSEVALVHQGLFDDGQGWFVRDGDGVAGPPEAELGGTAVVQ